MEEFWEPLWNSTINLQDRWQTLAQDWQTSQANPWARYEKVSETLGKAEPVTGQTPKRVIWKKNKTKLYRFELPDVTPIQKTPVFMLYAMINKPYILDMEPGNSYVEYLLKKGFVVYMLDWGVAGQEDKQNGFSEYLFDYLAKAIQRTLWDSGSTQVHMFAYCMGGTMGALYTALFPQHVKNLVLLAAPIDFRHAPLYNAWLRQEYFDVDKLVDTFGNIPPEVIDFGNKMLKPLSNFVNSWLSLFERVQDERFVHTWRVLNKWVNDGTPFPGEAYRQWIHDFYQDNKLIQKQLIMRGRTVDLSQIECPVLLLTAEHDHIVPPPQTHALLEHIQSTDILEHSYPVGHVSLVYGGMATKHVYPDTASWLAERD